MGSFTVSGLPSLISAAESRPRARIEATRIRIPSILLLPRTGLTAGRILSRLITVVMIVTKSFLFSLIVLAASAADTPKWPQFRGPSGTGVAAEDAAPPIEFSPATRVAWRADSGR